ncbi:hypothetical protein [Ornithinimicrobium kibberense]|uniref:hypothetical protein n=1 Tax=Ornithinimicrobium kibberense TaxID=282060 RepID=UPI00361A8C82
MLESRCLPVNFIEPPGPCGGHDLVVRGTQAQGGPGRHGQGGGVPEGRGTGAPGIRLRKDHEMAKSLRRVVWIVLPFEPSILASVLVSALSVTSITSAVRAG